MKVTKVPPFKCACGYIMDAATAASPRGAVPEPGDYSICMRCGRPLVFGERCQLRVATDVDMRNCPGPYAFELGRASVAARAMGGRTAHLGPPVLTVRRSPDEDGIYVVDAVGEAGLGLGLYWAAECALRVPFFQGVARAELEALAEKLSNGNRTRATMAFPERDPKA